MTSLPLANLSGSNLFGPSLFATSLSFDPARPWLAPLAGYTDLPFRMLCREYGASVCCTEMVSAKGLMYKSPGTQDLLRTVFPEEAQDSPQGDTPSPLAASPATVTQGDAPIPPVGRADAPLVVQLFGSEAPFLVQAVEYLQERGFSYFDLNMGCSVPKVTRTGSGAAMLKDVDNALHIARALVRAGGEGRVGFKFRLGWDAQNPVWEELGPALQDCGAAWLTLHPRYARQGFGGVAHWPALASLARKLHIPLIGSGDMFTACDGVRCIEETGVATVMYARGAMQDPAVFASHKALWEARHGQGGGAGGPLPELAAHCPQVHSRQALRAMIARHAELALYYGCERTALFKMRTFVPRYVHHLAGVRALRQGLSACTDWDSLNALLDTFLEEDTHGR